MNPINKLKKYRKWVLYGIVAFQLLIVLGAFSDNLVGAYVSLIVALWFYIILE